MGCGISTKTGAHIFDKSPQAVPPLQKATIEVDSPAVKNEDVGQFDWDRDFTTFNHDSLILPDEVPQRMAIVNFEELEQAFRDAPFLGKGGFGVVHQVNFRGQDVAVRKLDMGAKNRIAGDFIREVTVLGTLAHPNIVRLVGISCDANNRCLLYELMTGGSLADLIELSNAHSIHEINQSDEDTFIFRWADRVTCALDACLGLACLHECTLLHCDIKPDNILVRGNGQAALADFGLSRSHDGAEKGGKIACTIGYDDPDWQVAGKKYTSKSDMYAMGIVLLQLLSGRSPRHLGERLAEWEKCEAMTVAARVETMCDPAGSLLHEASGWDLDAASVFAELGVPCTFAEPDKRPSIRDTLDTFTKLAKLKSVQENCPGLQEIYSRVQEDDSDFHEDNKQSNSKSPRSRRKDRVEWGANLRQGLENFESQRKSVCWRDNQRLR